MRSLICILTMALLLCGCSVDKSWVRAARATKDYLGPKYLAYVEKDAELSEREKAREKLVVQSWEARIKEWEKTVEDE